MKLLVSGSPLVRSLLFTTLLVAFPWPSAAQRILGTDVSAYQPANIDWNTATNNGVRFAWSKATENTGWVNGNFDAQVAGAVAAKVYIGAYHFARPSSNPNITGANSADSEAAHFWSVAGAYVKSGAGYCVPMLDWEDPNMTTQLSATTLTSWVIEWCNSVSNYAYNAGVPGLRPVIYTGAWYSKPSGSYSGLTSAVTNYPAWISYYPSGNSTVGFGTPFPLTDTLPSPSSCYPWNSCQIWQYGDTNWTHGDSDVSAGDLPQFVRTFVIGAPVFMSPPTNLFVEAGSPATFRFTAAGTTPLKYQWQHNGINIGNATATSYNIPSSQAGDVGRYTVVLSNSYAMTTSRVAYLTIISNAPGAIPAPSGLVDWWPADGAAADLFTAYSGAPVGAVTYVAGERSSAWHFDGSTSYLVTGAPSLNKPWTACMWVKREQSSGTAAAITGDGANELKLEQYNGTHQVGFTIFGVGDYNFGYTAPQGVWTHLAFVASGTQMQLYANGVLAGTIATNCPCPRGWIGAGYVYSNRNIVDYLKGGLDEFQIFNRALSVAEINSIYSAGSAGVMELPTITGGAFVAANQFRISAQGLTGRSISIWSSPDLVTWTRRTTVSNPTGSITYTDSTATNDAQYYRLSQP
jgi:GH25 family lysozyme M1 (1,4-beta-N-acetylmuramidase)